MHSIESSIAAEATRFVKKDRTKLPLVASLYASSMAKPGYGRLTRATYFFIRHLDDALDGEMDPKYLPTTAVNDPVEYARDLQRQMTGESAPGKTAIAKMGQYVISGLEKRAAPSENPRAMISRIIDGMIFDHERRVERQPASTDALMGYYALFNDFVDITLMALGERQRTSSFPVFGFCQGRLYSVRDIEKDWRLGIINVPQEILSAAEISPSAPIEDVVNNSSITSWIDSEVEEGVSGMQETIQILNTLKEARYTRIMVGGLARGAMKRLPLIRDANSVMAKSIAESC